MDKKQERILLFALGLLILLFSLRFLIALRFVFFTILGLALIVVPAYLLVRYFRNKKRAETYGKSVEGRVYRQRERIQELAAKNEEEVGQINESIKSLEKQLAVTKQLTPTNRLESEKLLNAYQQEKKLRATKRAFFRASLRKLNNILSNHELSSNLEQKKQELLELQEDQYEELAELESIQYDIESDIFYLDAIDELSERLLEIKSQPSSSSNLLLELEKMTQKLER